MCDCHRGGRDSPEAKADRDRRPVRRPLTSTSLDASGKGSGLTSTALTRLKTAVFAPMARAVISTAVAAKGRCARSARSACRSSSRATITCLRGREI